MFPHSKMYYCTADLTKNCENKTPTHRFWGHFRGYTCSHLKSYNFSISVFVCENDFISKWKDLNHQTELVQVWAPRLVSMTTSPYNFKPGREDWEETGLCQIIKNQIKLIQLSVYGEQGPAEYCWCDQRSFHALKFFPPVRTSTNLPVTSSRLISI